MALLVSTVSNIFNLTPAQAMALRRIRETREAAKAICASIQYFKAKKDVAMLQHLTRDHSKKSYHVGNCDPSPTAKRAPGTSNNFLRIMQQGARSMAKESMKTNDNEEQHSGDSDDHSHEDYFQRQTNIFGKMQITDDTVFQARKKEYLKRKRMKECLNSFHHEHQQLKKLKREDELEAQFTQKIVKNEVVEIADRVELMEQTLYKQQQIIERQETAFQNLADILHNQVSKLQYQSAGSERKEPIDGNGV